MHNVLMALASERWLSFYLLFGVRYSSRRASSKRTQRGYNPDGLLSLDDLDLEVYQTVA